MTVDHLTKLREIKILSKIIDDFELKSNEDLIILDNIEENIHKLRIEFSKGIEFEAKDL